MVGSSVGKARIELRLFSGPRVPADTSLGPPSCLPSRGHIYAACTFYSEMEASRTVHVHCSGRAGQPAENASN